MAQHLVDRLLENIEIALSHLPVKIGEEGEECSVYLYRGEVANNAIKLAGAVIGMFTGKNEVPHWRKEFEDLSDEELLLRMRETADALLLEHEAKMVDVTPEDG